MLSYKPAPGLQRDAVTRKACKPVNALARDEQVEVPRRSLMASVLAVGALLAGQAQANEADNDRTAAAARRKAKMAALREKAEAEIAAGPAEKQRVDYVETSRGLMELDLSGLEERQRIAEESAKKLKALKDAEYQKMAAGSLKDVPPV